jgi:hypothetical protein
VTEERTMKLIEGYVEETIRSNTRMAFNHYEALRKDEGCQCRGCKASRKNALFRAEDEALACLNMETGEITAIVPFVRDCEIDNLIEEDDGTV